MTSTSNKVFIDTSVLVEALKGKKVNFYVDLVSKVENDFFINEAVLSEYLYYFLGINGGASPRSLQEKNKIAQTIEAHINEIIVLENFSLIAGTQSFLKAVPELMSKYNLLPNDAIILATCKSHNITTLASHDNDFINPCKEEGIELLREED